MICRYLFDCSAMRREIRSGSFWRDLLSEFFATFMLVSIQCVLPLTWGRETGFSDAVMTGLGMGFIVTTMAWSLGDFGGAHMNPAVTFAMTISLKMSILRGFLYIIVQMAGGLAGAGFAYAITPAQFQDRLSATGLGPGVTPWQGYLTEAWITCILVITIMGSTNPARKIGLQMPPLFIGLAVSLCIFAAWNHTGASMNPARSFGPAVVKGYWQDHWVYWAGPFTGSTLAAIIYFAIFDRVDRPKINDVTMEVEQVSEEKQEKHQYNNKALTTDEVIFNSENVSELSRI